VSRALSELLHGLLAGVAAFAGVRAAQLLSDPYSEPRLTVGSWIETFKGGDHA
jgi:hypothetical protein